MFHHELSNDLRLRIPGPIVPSPMDGPLSQHKKKKTYASSPPPPSPHENRENQSPLRYPAHEYLAHGRPLHLFPFDKFDNHEAFNTASL